MTSIIVPELTDDEIVKVLASLGIDTYPSKYGFPELQVSATSVPTIRDIVAAYLAATPQQAQAADDLVNDLRGLVDLTTWQQDVVNRAISALQPQAKVQEPEKMCCYDGLTPARYCTGCDASKNPAPVQPEAQSKEDLCAIKDCVCTSWNRTSNKTESKCTYPHCNCDGPEHVCDTEAQSKVEGGGK